MYTETTSVYILVTGGAGYIGSHICKALAKHGLTPVTLDNLSLGHEWAVKWGPFIKGDISDRKLIDSLCKKYRFQGVIHLAALSNVRESLQISIKYHENNVVGTIALLEILKKHQVPFFVQSSTCAIYGVPEVTPIEEDHPKTPINTYGETKWEVEKILRESDGMKIAALRYFNASGADLDGEIGESHDPETHLIPLLMQTALKKRSTFTLYGDDHLTPDGSPIRDFIHVADLAEAHVAALKWLMEKKDDITLNLGTGKGHSVKEVIGAVEQELNLSLPVEIGNRFAEDPPILVANPKRAIETLDWTPKHSNLSTIIQTAWQWHKNR